MATRDLAFFLLCVCVLVFQEVYAKDLTLKNSQAVKWLDLYNLGKKKKKLRPYPFLRSK